MLLSNIINDSIEYNNREKYMILEVMDRFNIKEDLIFKYLEVNEDSVADKNYIFNLINELEKKGNNKLIKKIDKIIHKKGKITYKELESIYIPEKEQEFVNNLFKEYFESYGIHKAEDILKRSLIKVNKSYNIGLQSIMLTGDVKNV